MATFNHWILHNLAPALSCTFLHSFWQGAAAACLAGVWIMATRKKTAALRYRGLVCLLVGLIATSAVTLSFQLSSLADGSSFPKVWPASAQVTTPFTPTLLSSVANDSGSATGLLHLFDRYATLLAGVWLLFFVFQLSRIISGYYSVQQLRRKQVRTAPATWQHWLQKQASKVGIHRTVRLLESGRITVPAAIGLLKPVVLLPVGLVNQLSPQQVESILLHELAHIKRNDYIVNLLQSLVEAVFFFNPAFTWISSLIREAREACCDEMVMLHTANHDAYIEALLSFQEKAPVYAMAFGGRKPFLLNRIRRILTKENNQLTRGEASGLLLGLVLLSCCFFAFRPKEVPPLTAAGNPFTRPANAKTDRFAAAPGSNQSLQKRQLEQRKDRVPATAKADTIPTEKTKNRNIRFTQIATNQVDDNDEKAEQILAMDIDGNRYRIRWEKGVITSLQVNDEDVPKKEYPRYTALFDALNLEQRLNKEKAVQDMKQRAFVLQQQKELVNQRLAQVDRQRQAEVLKQLSVLKAKQATLQKKRAYLQSQMLKETNQKLLLDKQISVGQNATLAAIIRELMERGLADSDIKLSFLLRNNEFIVNGKTQPQELLELFRKKYLKSSGDSYQYDRDGGTTRTEIHIQ